MSSRQPAETLQKLLAPALSALSLSGVVPKVYLGWPTPEMLIQDVRATPSKVHVSIFPHSARNVTRYRRVGPDSTISFPGYTSAAPGNVSISAATETAVVSTNTVTFAGTIRDGDNIFVRANGRLFGYHVSTGDTFAIIASAFASALNAAANFGLTCAAVGPVITISNASASLSSLEANCYGVATLLTEIARLERIYQISVWAESPQVRWAYEDCILGVLENINFLVLPGNIYCRIDFAGDRISDRAEVSNIAKQDFLFKVEYPVLESSALTVVGAGLLNLLPLNLPAVLDLPVTSSIVVGIGSGGMPHDHIWHEIPSGVRPGTGFTLSLIPKVGTEMVFLNSIQQTRKSTGPGLGEYMISGNTITMGMSVTSGDSLVVHYEI